MLDNCSQATFTVKTMNGEVTKSSEVLDGIEVAQASNEREEKVWVQLTSTYTQEDLLVDNREIVGICG